MYSILIRALLFILGFWFIKRIIAAFLGSPRQAGTGATARSPSKNMVKDPVCGMYMDSRLAIRVKKGNEVFYFCSEDCRKKFTEKAAVSADK
jgi:uncharacterized protein